MIRTFELGNKFLDFSNVFIKGKQNCSSFARFNIYENVLEEIGEKKRKMEK